MAQQQVPQNFDNHGRIVPAYHYAVFGVIAVNLLWSLIQLVRFPSFGTFLQLAMAGAIFGIFLYARLFALKAQDRVIRLEERIRLGELLPAELKSRIGELSMSQLVGLRFASDAEIPDLVRDVLDNSITDRKAIKMKIKNWRADYDRV